MNESQYTKRELDMHFSDIKDSLNRIETQTVRTNGRVGKLENWRWLITGGLCIISFIVIPLIVYIFNSQVNQVIAEISNRSSATTQNGK